MELLKSKKIWKLSIRSLPIILSAAGGYLYYHFVGGISGTCLITSNPWLSTGYGALVGLAFFSLKPKDKETDK